MTLGLSNEKIKESIESMYTNRAISVDDLSKEQPVMLIFLRHFGCTFCREALGEISYKRASIEKNGTRLVFVHMSEEEMANRYFQKYNLEGVDHISDPNCQYYAAFGLVKGNMTQLFGLRTWMRGFQAGVVEGHAIGKQLGDSFQMPGIFLIQGGVVRDQYIHKLCSDKPDYEKMTECCVVEG